MDTSISCNHHVPMKRPRSGSLEELSVQSSARRVRVVSPQLSSSSSHDSVTGSPVDVATPPICMPLPVGENLDSPNASPPTPPIRMPQPVGENLDSPNATPPTPPIRMPFPIGEAFCSPNGSPPSTPIRMPLPVGENLDSPNASPPTPPIRMPQP
ncbi:hypothetical protein K466DRAFT_605603, partial [Polyporus arcularius HHB13444]